MKLPEYDPIRRELEEEKSDHKDVVDAKDATLWFANKEMKPENALKVHVGANEKTKVVVKLSTKAQGQPCSESWMSPETQKRLMMENYKRMEELKKLEKDDDDSYLNSEWADNSALKRRFQGLGNVSWRPS